MSYTFKTQNANLYIIAPNARGYAIYDMDASVELYRDETIQQVKTGDWREELSLNLIRKICERVGKRIVAENEGLVWGGLDFDDSGNIP